MTNSQLLVDAGTFVRKDTAVKIGSKRTTIGTLFIKALNIAPINKVNIFLEVYFTRLTLFKEGNKVR